MAKYNVKVLKDANNDIKEIIKYIKYKLKEPEIAEEHRKAFKNAILKLKEDANIYKIIDVEIPGKTNVRKINVKNFMIFYRILDSINEVQVIAVYYARSNWQVNIKYR